MEFQKVKLKMKVNDFFERIKFPLLERKLNDTNKLIEVKNEFYNLENDCTIIYNIIYYLVVAELTTLFNEFNTFIPNANIKNMSSAKKGMNIIVFLEPFSNPMMKQTIPPNIFEKKSETSVKGS